MRLYLGQEIHKINCLLGGRHQVMKFLTKRGCFTYRPKTCSYGTAHCTDFFDYDIKRGLISKFQEVMSGPRNVYIVQK